MRAIGGQGGYPWSVERPQGEDRCIQFSGSTQAALDYDSTIIGALEMSEKKWLLAVQLPGVSRHSRHVLAACGDGLVSFVERLKARCAAAGRKVARIILTHEAGRDGFWLARFLAGRSIEVHIIQPSSLPVDRRARRAKTDIIDVEMLLRTLMACRNSSAISSFGPDARGVALFGGLTCKTRRYAALFRFGVVGPATSRKLLPWLSPRGPRRGVG